MRCCIFFSRNKRRWTFYKTRITSELIYKSQPFKKNGTTGPLLTLYTSFLFYCTPGFIHVFKVNFWYTIVTSNRYMLVYIVFFCWVVKSNAKSLTIIWYSNLTRSNCFKACSCHKQVIVPGLISAEAAQNTRGLQLKKKNYSVEFYYCGTILDPDVKIII